MILNEFSRNGHGYDVAKWCRQKFQWVSPVWYQLKPDVSGRGTFVQLTGGHDIDEDWIRDVRNGIPKSTTSEETFQAEVIDATGNVGKVEKINPVHDEDDDVLSDQEDEDDEEAASQEPVESATPSKESTHRVSIVPRFILEGWDGTALQKVLGQKRSRHQFVSVVMDEVRRNEYDGVVLEVTNAKVALLQKAAKQHGEAQQATIRALADLEKLIEEMAKALHQFPKRRSLILVISPHSQLFSPEEFQRLHGIVDRFSLMTYDYSMASVGPLSPITWMRECVERLLNSVKNPTKVAPKILMGLNFYGQDYSGQIGSRLTENPRAILHRDYINVCLCLWVCGDGIFIVIGCMVMPYAFGWL